MVSNNLSTNLIAVPGQVFVLHTTFEVYFIWSSTLNF